MLLIAPAQSRIHKKSCHHPGERMTYAHAILMIATGDWIEPPVWLRLLCDADMRYLYPKLRERFAEGIVLRPDGIVGDTTTPTTPAR
jgi:hypothetical protein